MYCVQTFLKILLLGTCHLSLCLEGSRTRCLGCHTCSLCLAAGEAAEGGRGGGRLRCPLPGVVLGGGPAHLWRYHLPSRKGPESTSAQATAGCGRHHHPGECGGEGMKYKDGAQGGVLQALANDPLFLVPRGSQPVCEPPSPLPGFLI